MSDDHTTKLDTPLLPAIRERAGVHFVFAEEPRPVRFFPSPVSSPWLEMRENPYETPKICITIGDEVFVADYCPPGVLESLRALGNAWLDRSALLRALDSLAAKAQAVVDSEGNSHEDDSGGSFHYMVEVDYGALHELMAALEEVCA